MNAVPRGKINWSQVVCEAWELELRKAERAMDLLAELEAERAYQDKKWGGAENDDRNTREDWDRYITQFAVGERGTSFRRRMIACAALALAQIEVFYRWKNVPVNRAKIVEEARGLSVVSSSDQNEVIQGILGQVKAGSPRGVIAHCLFYLSVIDALEAEHRYKIERTGEMVL